MERVDVYYPGVYSDSNEFPCMLWDVAEATLNDFKTGWKWSTPKMAAAPVLIYDRRIAQLEKEIKELKEMLASMNQSNGAKAPIIDLRDISVGQAKEEIAQYFRENDGREIDIDEIIEGLAIDPHTVVRVCNILEAEGKIG